jgi:hypothetical protein
MHACEWQARGRASFMRAQRAERSGHVVWDNGRLHACEFTAPNTRRRVGEGQAYGMRGMTGANVSSRKMRMSGVAPEMRVGAKKCPEGRSGGGPPPHTTVAPFAIESSTCSCTLVIQSRYHLHAPHAPSHSCCPHGGRPCMQGRRGAHAARGLWTAHKSSSCCTASAPDGQLMNHAEAPLRTLAVPQAPGRMKKTQKRFETSQKGASAERAFIQAGQVRSAAETQTKHQWPALGSGLVRHTKRGEPCNNLSTNGLHACAGLCEVGCGA